jgi:para-aminobenzoate synthetase/4-amino-4-deoxychorismate lyase
MKGTARRGRWATEDAAIGDWLHHSEKNRAENLMIVDLLRNDLSRIARPHSVQVSDLFAVKHHPTVWQMTSTIRAHTRPGISLNDLFTALFPCGSVTGAPKPRAMTLIAEREEQARGVYCGAIGLLRPGGDAIFNVAIRTARFQSGQAICGVGGGITWNSTADDEYAEALLKARFLDPAALPERVPLFETLRLENTDYWLLDRHLARLAGSAAYFDYPCDIAACHQALATLAQENPQGAWRVRLTLQADGTITTHVAPLPAPPEHARFTLATAAVNRNALWLHHKTMQRSFFDQALAAAQTTQPGIFDVLLHNEDGELTEFTRGNLVLEINGARYTPPLTSGLLDGTLRRELLERGEIIERILRQEDLLHATRILFINSLRGEIPLFIVS